MSNDNNDNKSLVENINPLELQKLQIEQMNEVAQHVVNQVDEDRDKADELYDFMRDQIDVDGDRNPATRQAMSDALGHKVESTKSLVEILKIKAKLINPNKGTNVNINLGDYDGKKGGDTNEMIDIAEKLRGEME